jgi:urease accessory protein
MNDIAVPPVCSWPATLKLGYVRTHQKTILAERQRKGPLAVQRMLHPEGDVCHTYLLHPPGGVAGGDTLDISVDVAAHASALVTTPGATKFYHSIGPQASLYQTLTVNDGCLEWLPQENILFPGAVASLETHVILNGDAKFTGWEITCLGRPVIDESFSTGSLRSRLKIERDGRLLLVDSLQVSSEQDLYSSAGLRGKPVTGTCAITVNESIPLDELRSIQDPDSSHELGITIVDGLLVARYLGDSTEQARKLFTRIWQSTRPFVSSRPACTPRIWNT